MFAYSIRGLPRDRAVYALPKKVCVVDDDDAVRDSMCALLGSYGIAAEGYLSGHDFLSRCAESADCVLLDLHMPNMDGLALVQALRREERFATLPVVMLTSVGGSGEAAAVAECDGIPDGPEHGDGKREVHDDLRGHRAHARRPRDQPQTISHHRFPEWVLKRHQLFPFIF